MKFTNVPSKFVAGTIKNYIDQLRVITSDKEILTRVNTEFSEFPTQGKKAISHHIN